jgi:hypothetical protein
VPTPVGPLGPDEFDPNDPDLWDWDAASTPRAPWSGWVRATACVIVVVFGLLAIASVFR